MYDKEKFLFEGDMQSKINGLNFQRDRIFNIIPVELWKKGVSPVHDVDFYSIILNRLRRELISRKNDSRVNDIITKNKNLLYETEVRHDFEHPTEDKMFPTTLSNLPPKTISGPEGAKTVIFTSLLNHTIVSGNFRWDLDVDHEAFVKLMKEFIDFYPFSLSSKTKAINL